MLGEGVRNEIDGGDRQFAQRWCMVFLKPHPEEKHDQSLERSAES